MDFFFIRWLGRGLSNIQLHLTRAELISDLHLYESSNWTIWGMEGPGPNLFYMMGQLDSDEHSRVLACCSNTPAEERES